MGLQWRSEGDAYYASEERRSGWGPFTLGVSDVQPIEMTNVFNTLAAEELLRADAGAAGDRPGRAGAGRGRAALPSGDHQGRGPRGHRRGPVRDRAGPQGRPVRPWGTSRIVGEMLDRPVAGKSGTTDDDRTSWFLGYTPQMTVGAFMADPDYIFNAVGSSNSTVSKETVGTILSEALEGEPVENFTPPSKQIQFDGKD
ncbi:hypothetical protein GCM10029992_00190 [Glycomyces albus]